MSGARFEVHATFDLPGRSGLLASGTVTEGSIAPGDVLREVRSGESRRVLSVEFPSPADQRADRVTLVLDGPREPIPPGTVLEAGSPVHRVHLFSLGEAHDDQWPKFYIDERAYADPAQAAADRRAAKEFLARSRVIYSVETFFGPEVQVPAGLPTWAEFRQRHVVEGEPLPVRPVPKQGQVPPGWEAMSAEVDRAYAASRDELVAILREALPGQEPQITWDRGPNRYGPASVYWSEERYGFLIMMSVYRHGLNSRDVLEQLGSALRRAGWDTHPPETDRTGEVLTAERGGLRVWAHAEPSSLDVHLQSPLYRAPDDPAGPAWITEPHPGPGQQYGRAGHNAQA
jgi:hypothetical protein